MPGMIEHLYYDQLIYHSLSSRPTTKILKNGDAQLQTEYKQTLNRERFVLSEILPDMAISVFESHFRIRTHKANGLFIPNVEASESVIRHKVDWSIRMGIYAHLCLDRAFVLNFLLPRFEWNTSDGKIVSKTSGEVFKPRDFFSENGLYSAYSETTKVLVDKEKLRLKSIRNLPDTLPKTGVKAIDEIVAEPWKERLEWYIANAKEQTDQVFSAEEYIAFIENEAVNTTAQILHRG